MSTDFDENYGIRRRLRGRRAGARWLAMLVVLGMGVAACGGDDDSTDAGDDAATGQSDGTAAEAPGDTTAGSGGGAAAAPGDVDPDGVLRIGTAMEYPGGIHLDPAQSVVSPDLNWMKLVFGTLFRWNPEAEIEPWMAKSFEIVDDRTLRITLRDGVTFSDGTPYDAEAVRAGLLRTLNEPSKLTEPSLSVAFKAITDVVVDDPKTVTITLGTPQVGELVQALAQREGAIVSPKQAESAPDEIDGAGAIGAGPYLVEEFVNEQRVVLTKNPDFWDAESWQLGGIEFHHVLETTSRVNGLRSGDLDMAIALSPVDVNQLEGDDAFEIKSLQNDRAYSFLLLCRGKAPFDDLDARRALQVAIDRQGVSDLVYEGVAEPQLGFWPADHPNYNPAVEEFVTYDPDKARELLGGEEIDMNLAYVAASPGHDTMAEVLQAQLGEVGINVTIMPTSDPVSEFISPQKSGALLIPGSRTGVDKYARVYQEGQVQALCGESRPDIVEALAPASALVPGDPAATELFQQAELTIAEEALNIPVTWSPVLTAWSSERVGGEAQFNASTSDPMLDTFYIKS